MTVGIAAVCEAGDEPKIVAAADRLVTTSMGGSPIEYEHPAAKIHELNSRNEFSAIAITAGYATYADELYHKIDSGINNTPDDEELTIRDIAVFAADCYNEILRESANRQVLGSLGLNLGDLKNQEQFHLQFLSDLVGDIQGVQNDISDHLHVLIAGVDKSGADIFQVVGGDIADQNSIGYSTVGSGMQPAQSEFIHSRYDNTCELLEGQRTVISAKVRSEEAQGVGEQMDAVVIQRDEIRPLGPDEIRELRDQHEEIEEKQDRVKELVINNEDFEINVHNTT